MNSKISGSISLSPDTGELMANGFADSKTLDVKNTSALSHATLAATDSEPSPVDHGRRDFVCGWRSIKGVSD